MSNGEVLSTETIEKNDNLTNSTIENDVKSSNPTIENDIKSSNPTIENDVKSLNSDQPTEISTNLNDKITSDVNDQVKNNTQQIDSEPSKDKSFHLIKWIDFNFEHLPILLQNVNGPCPLLAIFNILLLRKRIVIDLNMNAISTGRVVTLLAEHILELDQSKLSDEDRVNYEHNVQDALSVIEKLKTGLDVNLKFDGVDKFEYTRECIIFDLLNIHLYHGWVIDPQDVELQTIVKNDASSYNQLVEKMIRQRHSDREELLRESLLIEQFLDENRSQLTHYGILQLNQTMRENQFAVFFRNNHFNTIWKHENQILLLVSDQGYLDHSSIVFETLTDIDNDSLFTDGYGRIWSKEETNQSNQDRDLAIALHNEEERLYHEHQLKQQTQENGKQSKKSKTKQKQSSNDNDEKDSCNIL